MPPNKVLPDIRHCAVQQAELSLLWHNMQRSTLTTMTTRRADCTELMHWHAAHDDILHSSVSSFFSAPEQGIWHAEDLLKVLEQQAHSALSEKPSISGQDAATAPVSPINQAEPSESPPQLSSPAQVMLDLLQHQAAVKAWLCMPFMSCMPHVTHCPCAFLSGLSFCSTIYLFCRLGTCCCENVCALTPPVTHEVFAALQSACPLLQLGPDPTGMHSMIVKIIITADLLAVYFDAYCCWLSRQHRRRSCIPAPPLCP